MAVFMLANVNFYSVLSDFILLIHFAFVAFIVAGFLAIWVGYFRHWAWVHNFRFRLTHLLAMGFVLLESLFGIVCPLTVWEDQLRQRAGGGTRYRESFMQHWLGRVLFYDLSERAFIMIYAGCFILIVLTFWLIPVRWPRRLSRRGST